MPEILVPAELEHLSDDDDVVLEEVCHQINLKLRRHFRPGAPCYIRLDPWPHDRIVNAILEIASDRWNAVVEVSHRFSPYVLRFEELPPEMPPDTSAHRYTRLHGVAGSPGR